MKRRDIRLIQYKTIDLTALPITSSLPLKNVQLLVVVQVAVPPVRLVGGETSIWLRPPTGADSLTIACPVCPVVVLVDTMVAVI